MASMQFRQQQRNQMAISRNRAPAGLFVSLLSMCMVWARASIHMHPNVPCKYATSYRDNFNMLHLARTCIYILPIAYTSTVP